MRKLAVTTFFLIGFFSVYAQSFILRGTVVDETEMPVENVTIYVEERGKTESFTNSEGKFQILLPDTTKHKTVVFLFEGYPKQEYRINPPENDVRFVIKKVLPAKKEETPIKITETDDEAILLDEVVVVSYGVMKKSDLTGSISSARNNNNNIRSGILTAGEVNDFAKWHLWSDILKYCFGRTIAYSPRSSLPS